MNNFRISAPFVNAEEIQPLKEAGVNELYCGYIDNESERFWPSCFLTINRRGKGQSFEDFTVFKAAVEEAYECGLPIYVAMNGLYTGEQYPWLLKTIKKISALDGIKGLIVADMGLLLTLKKLGYKKEVRVSTGGTTLNGYTADFFHSLGARSVVLDRQLSANEIAALVSQRKSGIGMEIFILGDACLFIDGYCAFSHCLSAGEDARAIAENVSLLRSYNISIASYGCDEVKGAFLNNGFKVHNISGAKAKIKPCGYQPGKYSLNCNLCSLYMLKSFSAITLKIAGRGSAQSTAAETVSRALRILERKGLTYRQYQKEAKRLRAGLYKQRCDMYSCYCHGALVAGR